MPRVYRSMKSDPDGMPVVDASGKGLGVRPEVDVDLDTQGTVVLNDKGMSVAPAWRSLPYWLIPARLRHLWPEARGANVLHCFFFGTGEFVPALVTPTLKLVPTSPRHGCLVPTQCITLAEYQHDLAATRAQWQLDET